MKQLNVIVTGGGTAGHIYPAIAVAQRLRDRGHNILFVGANGKMEMEKVPFAGFEIVGLPVAGFNRKQFFSNFSVAIKMGRAILKSRRIINRFKPDVVVGFGGYASAPIMKAAQMKGVKTILHESNSYAGVTNRLLGGRADVVCCGYDGMDKFFSADKIVVTGTPLRVVPYLNNDLHSEALSWLGLVNGPKTILVVGGSLGARSLNEVMIKLLEREPVAGIQILWQTGTLYYDEMVQRAAEVNRWSKSVVLVPFIDRMDYAYLVADVVICRAGAGTISELSLLGKVAVFVPSPNVAEDHQTKNAMSLVRVGAAEMVADVDAQELLFDKVFDLLGDNEKMIAIAQKVKALAKPNAVDDVVNIVEGVYNTERNIFFVGVGGIGMSALARFFKYKGYHVGGYDLTQTPLTLALQNEGIEIIYEDCVNAVPKKFKSKNTYVIITPAIPSDNKILHYYKENGFEVKKRSEALGLLCNDKFLMAVAGTHGKTTTSSMASHFLVASTGEGSAFLGGIAKNFESNVVMGQGKNMIVEADEFDRSFWQLTPDVAVITAADPDHLDIYGTPEEFKVGFETFIDKIKEGGRVIIKKGVDLKIDRKDISVYSYSLNDSSCDFYATNLHCDAYGQYEFDIVTPSKHIEGCRLSIAGLVNVENCVAAVALVDSVVFDSKKLRLALSSYCGVARRFDMWVKDEKGVYMDDYAHHPDELRAMLTSVKDIFPNRHITIVFQPHLYSRTKDFAEQFANSLSIADKCILIPIYPARELPMDGVTSKIIYDKVTCEKEMVEKEKLNNHIENMDFDVLITAGAGNIDQHCAAIAEIVHKRIESKR